LLNLARLVHEQAAMRRTQEFYVVKKYFVNKLDDLERSLFLGLCVSPFGCLDLTPIALLQIEILNIN
jgi:hypothetical protein